MNTASKNRRRFLHAAGATLVLGALPLAARAAGAPGGKVTMEERRAWGKAHGKGKGKDSKSSKASSKDTKGSSEGGLQPAR